MKTSLTIELSGCDKTHPDILNKDVQIIFSTGEVLHGVVISVEQIPPVTNKSTESAVKSKCTKNGMCPYDDKRKCLSDCKHFSTCVSAFRGRTLRN